MLYELCMLAINNLARARARLAMTAGGVLVGTTAVILLIALTFGLQNAAEAGIGNDASLTEIEVYPNYNFTPGATQPENVPQLTVDAVKSFWQIEGVSAVIPITRLQGGQITAGRVQGYADVVGIDPALLPYLGITVDEGELSLEPGTVLVGPNVGDYFYDPENTSDNFQPVQVDLFTERWKFELYQYSSQTPSLRKIDGNPVGKLTPGSRFDYSILMPIKDVLALNEWVTGNKFDPKTFIYDQVIVRSANRETTNAVSTALRELGYASGGMGEYLNQLNNFFVTMRLMLGSVGGVALLVAAFGVANTMTMAILERTREIGLMKAIGATDRDVLTVFLIEAGLVGLAGGVAGVVLSYFLQNLVNQGLANLAASGGSQQGSGFFFLPFDPNQIGGNLFVIPTELALFALGLATAVGLGAGLYPALRAARLPPVIALKME